LRLALLRQRDADHNEHKAEQEQRFGPVAQRQVDTASGQQHQEHRLGEYLSHDRQGRFRCAAG